jgi:RNHCP domain
MNAHQNQVLGRRAKSRFRYGQPERNSAANSFRCAHCHGFVYTESGYSGVQNRNHCPYCLWSRHLDLYTAGDRLSACKALMEPIGLTTKSTRKKYNPGRGELMLIHLCIDCTGISINRIAADDDPQKLLTVFESSFHLEGAIMDLLEFFGIRLLGEADNSLIRPQLFGKETSLNDIFHQDRVFEIIERT